MLTQRSEGLRRLFLLCQIAIVAALFWFGVWVMITFYSESGDLTWRRYFIYCVLLVLGMTFEFLGRDHTRDYVLQHELLRQHRLTLRQIFFSVGTLVLYLIATKDGFISRIFLFNLIPWLYVALLFSHHYLPPLLARKIFTGIREEKTLLIGPGARAQKLRPWLDEKARIGLRTAGILSENDDGNFPWLGRPEDFDRVVREEGITQVIMLEVPRDDLRRDLINVCNQLVLRVVILSDLEDTLHHPVVHFEDDGFGFIGLRQEPLENPFNRFLKRRTD